MTASNDPGSAAADETIVDPRSGDEPVASVELVEVAASGALPIDGAEAGASDASAEGSDDGTVAVSIDALIEEWDAADEPVADELTARRNRRAALVRSSAATASSTDSVRAYLVEIGRVPLLNTEQEVAVAERIAKGSRAAEKLADAEADGTAGMLSASQRRRLEHLARDGERAKDELVQANLRLVVSIAKRYTNRGMPLLDLVQEGNFGLIRAVEKFDHTKGFKFSTYATWWIRQAVTRALADQSRTIRIPVHMVDSIARVTRAQRQMATDLKRDPTIEELSLRVEMSPDKVRDVLRVALDPLSLDSTVGDGDDAHLSDFIEDVGAKAPEEEAARQMLNRAVEQALGQLSEREQQVVRMRFGLDTDGAPLTLEEVGKHFGVTRERIRQIESKTLAKLRQPQRRALLRDYLDEG